MTKRAAAVVLIGLLAACGMNTDPALVACEEDAHCPDGWYCPGAGGLPAMCSEGVRTDDDDSGLSPDDDDSSPDDDDSAPDDDDGVPPALSASFLGGLCSAAGESRNASFNVVHCTGPASAPPGVSSSSGFTVVVGASRLIRTPE